MNVSHDTLLPAAAPSEIAGAGVAPRANVERRGRRWRGALIAVLAAAGVAVLAGGILVWLARAGDRPLAAVEMPPGDDPAPPQELRRLESRLAAAGPRAAFIVIDTVQNRLELVRGDQVILEAPCSTGTGAVLADPASGRRWVFDTPRGAHKVQIKLRDPVWKKPDWAFIEEGKPLPKNPNERFDFEALGDYGLYFGDGYLIHGTLYQRLLGRSVTHGCIRLGDHDLEALFRATPIGTPIYIF